MRRRRRAALIGLCSFGGIIASALYFWWPATASGERADQPRSPRRVAFYIDGPLNLDKSIKKYMAIVPPTYSAAIAHLRVAAVGVSTTRSEASNPLEPLSALFSEDYSCRLFKSPRFPIYKRPTGFFVRQFSKGDDGSVFHGERNIDGLLAACALSGVSLSQPVAFADGSQTRLRDLFESSRLAFVDSNKCSYSAIAYACYAPSDHRWQNRFGERVSYEGIVHQLMTIDSAAACPDIQALCALTVLLDVNDEYPFLSTELGQRTEDCLTFAAARAETTQKPDGSWPLMWNSAEPALSPESVELSVWMTARMLEWQSLASQPIRLRARTLDRALRFLLDAYNYATSNDIERYYDAYSTALCSLMLVSRR